MAAIDPNMLMMWHARWEEMHRHCADERDRTETMLVLAAFLLERLHGPEYAANRLRDLAGKIDHRWEGHDEETRRAPRH